MNASSMNVYRAMAHAQAAAAEASTFDEALRAGLRAVVQDMGIAVAIMWYALDGKSCLLPYFWIGNVDLAGCSCKLGEGCVGHALQTQRSARMLAYEQGTDPISEAALAGTVITSMQVVPISTISDNVCVVQLVNKQDGSSFTDEEADACEILALLAFRIFKRQEIQQATPSYDRRLIEVRDVTRDFVNGSIVTHVLKGINLSVLEGEFVVLLGESGCGKSTLLNIIAGLDGPTGGVVRFKDTNIANASEAELTEYRRDNIGFVFQSYNLMPNLTARENLSLIGELVSDPVAVDEALAIVGLQNRKDSLPSQLSGGQQQRVSIARALVKRPSLLFADEPTAALDNDTSIEVLRALRNVVSSGTTLMMVTHNEAICRIADRVIRIRDGRVSEVVVNRVLADVSELEW